MQYLQKSVQLSEQFAQPQKHLSPKHETAERRKPGHTIQYWTLVLFDQSPIIVETESAGEKERKRRKREREREGAASQWQYDIKDKLEQGLLFLYTFLYAKAKAYNIIP